MVELAALIATMKSAHILTYAAGVFEQEPPSPSHPLLGLPGVILTPHIGSRTYESVQRQANPAVENLTRYLAGDEPPARANSGF
jgi:phosphoglycerate dehydrogenase-like enzyme